jgi:hypothetical protein
MCHEWLPLSEFSKDRGNPDGLNWSDRRCLALARTERLARQANRRLLQAEYNRRWEAAHPDYQAAYQPAYRAAHRGRRLEQSTAWNAAHREAMRAANRRYRERRRAQRSDA